MVEGRVLILDSDPDCLIRLQQVLEDAGIDTTITWDKVEASQSLVHEALDLVVIGDHPPELDSAAVLDDFSFRGTCPPVLILQGHVHEIDVDHFHRPGVVGVVSKQDALAVLEQVMKALGSKVSKAAFVEARLRRAAS